ncbi:MAG: hypothetical protein HWD62_05285 [Cyclobacteriaceae bacterium]|nr:MAG: hypothetical protein HWD62_05285 [Cyclobacteriaceae bacterium]
MATPWNKKFTSSGAFISIFGQNSTTNGQFSGPHGTTVDIAGNIYVVDREHHRIQKFNNSGQFVSAWEVWVTEMASFSFH